MKKPATTLIKHDLRTKLHLTCDEYVVFEFINRHSGITPNDEALVKVTIGFEWNNFLEICKYGIGLGYIESDGERIEGTDKLFNDFSDNQEEHFEKFWKIAPKGNKQKARIQFNKCLKIISYLELETAYLKYIKSVNDLQYQMHVATWLNPEMRHWEDVYDIKENQQNVSPIKSIKNAGPLTIR